MQTDSDIQIQRGGMQCPLHGAVDRLPCDMCENARSNGQYHALERGMMARIASLETEVRRLRDITDIEIPNLKIQIARAVRMQERISDRQPSLTSEYPS